MLSQRRNGLGKKVRVKRKDIIITAWRKANIGKKTLIKNEPRNSERRGDEGAKEMILGWMRLGDMQADGQS